MPSVGGRYSMEPLGPEFLQAYRSGAIIQVDDLETDIRMTDAARAMLRGWKVGAFADVVLFEEERMVTLFAVQSATMRRWTSRDIDLIRDAAHRVRSAIHRARTEEAFRSSEERFRQFGNASQDILWIRDAENLQWQYLTPAFVEIYGLSREEALAGNNYRSWLDLIVPEDRERAMEAIQRVRAGEHVAFEYRVRRPVDGAIRWIRNTDFPIVDETGAVTLIGGIGHDLTELRETELRLTALIEGIPQLVWRAGEPGLWTWASPQWTEFTGQQEADSRDWGWLEPLHPEDRQKARNAWVRAAKRGGFEAEYRISTQEAGSYRWFQTRATPVRSETGEIMEWLGTSTDIDDLRTLQERQRILVAELQHRTFNLMGMVRSMADATIRSSTSLDEFKPMFRDRIDALARVQRLLSRLKEEDRVAFDELIRSELEAAGALDDGEGRVTLDGPEGVALRSSTVQTFAMALHELTTNAVKYGALKQPGARLEVCWRVERRKGDQPWLYVDWRETGVAMPPADAAPQGTGQGRRLIEQGLPYQLKAETTYVMGADGVRCSIALPVSERTTAETSRAS